MEFSHILFLGLAALAVVAAFNVILQRNPIYSAIGLIVVLCSLAALFLTLSAQFIAAMQIIVYAGAIMVLFVFVIMMLNLGPQSIEQERRWLQAELWLGPTVLSLVLLGELIYLLAMSEESHPGMVTTITPKQVGISLYGPYLIGVELASLLLLAGLIGAYHLGRRLRKDRW
jgi:NADH-quinone oxidoreductase subunit J